MSGFYLLAGIIFVISMIVSQRLKSKFAKYSQISLSNRMSGKEIAEKMLADNGITNVKVISVKGRLTDHYNPINKTVNLSEAVYSFRNAAAAAVAAHECGHAVQHAQAYRWLTLRSKLVPVVNIASRFMQWILVGGLLILAHTGNPTLMILGIVLYSVTTIFSIITLPVEYDASARALRWMKEMNMVTKTEFYGAKDSLKWAARTYLVAALGSIATLIYLIAQIRR